MFDDKVKKVLNDIYDLLIEKNKSYGNSVLEPIDIFSKIDRKEKLYVRIDDKLSRLKRGSEFGTEDTITDLIGYLVMLKIIENEEKE